MNGRLEKLSAQYEKSVESGFLINSYLNINRKASCSELEKLWESSIPAERRKCANVVRQLQQLSRKLEDTENGERARDIIDKFAEKLERDLLNDFDNAYRSADLVAMKDSAEILTDFNGGSSVVQMFVNQHDYFIIQENLVDASSVEKEEMWSKMCDPEGDFSEFDEIMQSMGDNMGEVIMQELEIIRKVFPDPVIILKVFLQRVFAQKIQLQIEAYLNKAESLSSLAYMRTLHIAYSKIAQFTSFLKTCFSKSNVDTNGELAALLDQNFSDIFVPYIENGQYFDAEVRSLGDIISQTMAKFTEAHSHKFSGEKSLLSRFTSSNTDSNVHLERHTSHSSLNGAAGAGSNAAGGSGDKETGRIGQLMRAVRLERTNSDRKSTNSIGEGEETIEVDDSEIRPEMVQRILTAMAESVRRSLELADQSQIPGHAKKFLEMLIESLGNNCTDVVLDGAIQVASSQDSKSPTDFGFIKPVREVTNTVMLISGLIKTVIYPMVSSNSPQLRTVITNMVNSYLERTETKINRILSMTSDVTLTKLTYILSKQKKKDYNPKDDFFSHSDAINIDMHNAQPSPVCTEVVQFLNVFHKAAVVALDGSNLESLLDFVGFSFKDLLLDHFKKFNVNPQGGGQVLRKDLQKYIEAINAWNIDALSNAICALGVIGELFTVSPADVAQLIKTNPDLAQNKPYVLREYLSKRTDYLSSSIHKVLAPINAGAGNGTNGNGSTAGRDRSQSYLLLPMVYPTM